MTTKKSAFSMKSDHRPDNPLLISSEILNGCLEAADELGIELSETLAECGIEQRLLTSHEGFLVASQVIEFLELVATRFNCPHFGFTIGSLHPPLKHGIVTQLFKLSPSVKSVIENVIQYGALHNELSVWSLRVEGSYAYLVRSDRQAYRKSLIQLHTLAVTLGFKILQRACEGNLNVSFVSFAHTAPEERKRYERFFQCPVHFDQAFDGIVFPAEYLQYPIKTADPELLIIVQAHLSSLLADYHPDDNIVAKVQLIIRQRLGTNGCNIESVALLLDMHPRALQRELKKNDCTFKMLLSDIRHEVAEHYLRSSNIRLVDLADILGYKNVSAFSLAFKNKKGKAPNHWRESLAIND